MSNYQGGQGGQGGYPPEEYGGYTRAPGSEVSQHGYNPAPGPEQQQSYPPTFPTASFLTTDPSAQPLLASNPSGGSGSVSFAAEPERTSKHYGQAPVRQPRRYKT